MNLNYRSLPAIVQAADAISEKRAVASRNGSPGVFQTRTFDNTIAEANAVADHGWLAAQEESNLNGIAVLYRRHSQAGVIEAALHHLKVPFASEVPYATLHNIAPLFSYLWLAAGRGTVNDVKKSLNTPFRFIKAEVGEMLGSSLSPPPVLWVEHLKRLDVPARTFDWAQLVDRLALMVENEQPPVAIVKTLLVGLGRDTKHHSLIDVASFYTDIHDLLDEMCEGDSKKKAGSKITLSTTHAAKGKEWPLVFFVGYDPVGAAEDLTGEEKRLNYVAFTRAMDALYVSKIEKSEDD
jgi:superfamily I DNA/RNA helicase